MSPHTIHSYRDSLLLLLRFVASDRKIDVCDLDVDDLEPHRVPAYLAHLGSGALAGSRPSSCGMDTAQLCSSFRGGEEPAVPVAGPPRREPYCFLSNSEKRGNSIAML